MIRGVEEVMMHGAVVLKGLWSICPACQFELRLIRINVMKTKSCANDIGANPNRSLL
jgi:hypothetical protein